MKPLNPPERRVLTPSSLNREVRFHLENGFGLVWLQGEISNFVRPRSGHLYFSLKDSGAQIRCAFFKGRSQFCKAQLADGQQVLVRGKVSLFEPRGDYQLIVDYAEDAGEGELRRQFDALKQRLAAEGVFDQARGRPLPRFPRTIAVITAATGAAIQDVRSVVSRRFPIANLVLFASEVQGKTAATTLRDALRRAIATSPQVILLTRGGGSLEDLWSFNDEGLARDIAASPIPVVSAVGHEIDFTIADFAADYRAPTPSAGAELITPDIKQVEGEVEKLTRAMQRCHRVLAEQLAQWVDRLEHRLYQASPERTAAAAQDRVARLSSQLSGRTSAHLDSHQQRVAGIHARLLRAHPRRQLDSARLLRGQLVQRLDRAIALQLSRHAQVANAVQQRYTHLASKNPLLDPERAVRALQDRIASAIRDQLEGANRRTRMATRTLTALSPEGVIERGYSLTFDTETGALITTATETRSGQSLSTRLKDGTIQSTVD